MATDIVIKFEGGEPADGESTLGGFEGWLEAKEFTEGAFSPRDPHGTGQATGRTTVHAVTFKSISGKHSNPLRTAMFRNKAFKTVKIYFLKQINNVLQAYDKREYTNGYISGFDAKKLNDSPMEETWTLHATKTTWSYQPQDPVSHELQGGIDTEWSNAESQ